MGGKKVLITGATGFVGSSLLRRCLQENAEVHILTTEASDKWRINDVINRVHGHCVDLLDCGQLTKIVSDINPKIIFHLAAYGVYAFQKDVNKVMETNFLGTINLVNACKNIEFELFVNTGSSFEYGIKSVPLNENDMLEPINEYGISKAASTLYCQGISKIENKSMATLRLFTPYGYYEKLPRLIPSVIISCLKSKNPKVSSPESVRDFVFIDDVVDAYIKLVDNSHKAKGEIFNIGYGKQSSIGDAVDIIIGLIGGNVVPEWGSIQDNRIESRMWQADISKAEILLNWKPKYNLDQGLRNTIEWFKENIGLYSNR